MRGTESAMDRVTANTLGLADLAKYWARAAKSIHTQEEIMSLLVQAFWSGDLTVEVPAGHMPRARHRSGTEPGAPKRTGRRHNP